MRVGRSINLAYVISALVHIMLMVLFMAFRFSIEHEQEDFVTVGFGTYGELSSSGKQPVVKEIEDENKVEKREEKKPEEKKVEVPATKNLDENNVQVTQKESKDEKPEETPKTADKDENKDKGREVAGEGSGKFGLFDIEWGGKGKRKIYSYNIPPYPEGVAKEIDVKLRFTILPDGTVGRIFPLIKADTRLETAAINSLRQWRFEPLPTSQKEAEQSAVIIFPFRLR
ncbi:MAG: energy transducer TonB [Melioribacteraceae bacterium]|nr:energy transducer TonB [Melioribacteraceae bacterium]